MIGDAYTAPRCAVALAVVLAATAIIIVVFTEIKAVQRQYSEQAHTYRNRTH